MESGEALINGQGNWRGNHLTMKQIRIKHGTPTTESKIYTENLRYIYRWYATQSSTYLNNKDEYDMDIKHFNHMVMNLQSIIAKKTNIPY